MTSWSLTFSAFRAIPFFIVASFLYCERVAAQASVSMEQIVKAWQQRQDRVRSARFSWLDRQTYTRGVHSEMGKKPGSQEREIPARDTTINIPHSMSFQGESLRYVYDGPDWSEAKGEYVPGRAISTFNGKVCKAILPKGTPNTYYPTGSIKVEPKHIDAQVPSLRPLLTAYRGLVPNLRTYDLEDMRIGQMTLIDGKSCLEIADIRRGGRMVRRLWLDTTRDFLLVRAIHTTLDKVTQRTDIRYREHPEAGWVPTGWDIVNFNVEGSVQHSFQASVTAVEVNPTIDPEEFDIVFPPGSVVTDERAKVDYLVRPDGSRRIIGRTEGRATYEQLMADIDGGETLREGGEGWLRAKLVLGGVVALTFFALIWRKWRNRCQTSS